MKNSLMLLSNYLILVFIVLIIFTNDNSSNPLGLNLNQSGFQLGSIPIWNFFRSPLLLISGAIYIINLSVMMRTSDGSFKPFEFQPLAELYSDRGPEFCRILSFNRMAVFFSMAVIFTRLFLGDLYAGAHPINGNSSLWPDLWFLGKSAIIIMVCLVLKARLPLISLSQILHFNLKIQIPVLTIVWWLVLFSRWLK
jgi:NADH:ubiquinone oxidoreductase subunit H